MLTLQTAQLESTTAGMAVVFVVLAALTLLWLWAVARLYRERRWVEALRDTGLIAVWIGLLGGGGWLLSTQIDRGQEVARRAIPEYCPQVRGDIRRGVGPLEAADSAVQQMQRIEPAIRTLDAEDLARRLLRVCRDRTGWSGFRVPEDTAPADTGGGAAADSAPSPGGISPLPGTGSGG